MHTHVRRLQDDGQWLSECIQYTKQHVYLRMETVKRNKSKAIIRMQTTTLKLMERNRSVFFDGYFNF